MVLIFNFIKEFKNCKLKFKSLENQRIKNKLKRNFRKIQFFYRFSAIWRTAALPSRSNFYRKKRDKVTDARLRYGNAWLPYTNAF